VIGPLTRANAGLMDGGIPGWYSPKRWSKERIVPGQRGWAARQGGKRAAADAVPTDWFSGSRNVTARALHLVTIHSRRVG